MADEVKPPSNDNVVPTFSKQPSNDNKAAAVPPVLNPQAANTKPADRFKENKELVEEVIEKITQYSISINESNRNFLNKFYTNFMGTIKISVLDELIKVAEEREEPAILENIRDILEKNLASMTELVDKQEEANKLDAKRQREQAEESIEDERAQRTDGRGKWFGKFFKPQGEEDKFGDIGNSITDKLSTFYGFLLDPKLFMSIVAANSVGWLTKAIGTAIRTPALLFISGIALLVTQGMDGWLKAGENNTAEIQSAIAGFLAGPAEKGIMDSLKHFGGWALTGAGIGLVGGLPGAIAGGIIGLALGGIFDAVGQMRMADWIQGLTDWFQKTTDRIFGTDFYFNDELEKRITETQAIVVTRQQEIAEAAEQMNDLWRQIDVAKKAGDQALADSLYQQLLVVNQRKFDLEEDLDREASKLAQYTEDAKEANISYWERFETWWNNLRDGTRNAVFGYFADIGGRIAEDIEYNKDRVLGLANALSSNIVDPIVNFFIEIADFVTTTVNGMVEGVKNAIFTPLQDLFNSVTAGFANLTKWFSDKWNSLLNTFGLGASEPGSKTVGAAEESNIETNVAGKSDQLGVVPIFTERGLLQETSSILSGSPLLSPIPLSEASTPLRTTQFKDPFIALKALLKEQEEIQSGNNIQTNTIVNNRNSSSSVRNDSYVGAISAYDHSFRLVQ